MDTPEAKTENFELPTPTGSGPTEASTSAAEQGQAQEQKVAAAGSDPTAAAYSMPGAVPAAPDPATVAGASAPLAAATGDTHGLAAEDADLIEKTWVNKAKQIVAETRGDPYNQNKQINKVKADYIKKRYNKDIKLISE